MERISTKSKLQIVNNTEAVSVPSTGIAFREHHRVQVLPTTPCAPATKKYNFQIQPVMPSELNLADCNVIVTFKVTKNSKTYEKKDQISCVNYLGVLAWDKVKVSIAGNEIFSAYSYENHATFLKLETSFTKTQKENQFIQIGYREGK